MTSCRVALVVAPPENHGRFWTGEIHGRFHPGMTQSTLASAGYADSPGYTEAEIVGFYSVPLDADYEEFEIRQRLPEALSREQVIAAGRRALKKMGATEE